MLHRLQEELVAIPLTSALDGEDEVVPPPPERYLAVELWMPQTLPADGVPHGILHHGLDFSYVALVPAALLRGLLLRHLIQADDALGEAFGELDRVVTEDGLLDRDGR